MESRFYSSLLTPADFEDGLSVSRKVSQSREEFNL
jgi:hypothetical protein